MDRSGVSWAAVGVAGVVARWLGRRREDDFVGRRVKRRRRMSGRRRVKRPPEKQRRRWLGRRRKTASTKWMTTIRGESMTPTRRKGRSRAHRRRRERRQRSPKRKTTQREKQRALGPVRNSKESSWCRLHTRPAAADSSGRHRPVARGKLYVSVLAPQLLLSTHTLTPRQRKGT
jgi:hypothetical protein